MDVSFAEYGGGTVQPATVQLKAGRVDSFEKISD